MQSDLRTIFFLSAASAFASAFASFFAVSFSSFSCASKLNVPIFACSASTSKIPVQFPHLSHPPLRNLRRLHQRPIARQNERHTFRVEFVIESLILFFQPLLASCEARAELAVLHREQANCPPRVISEMPATKGMARESRWGLRTLAVDHLHGGNGLTR